MDGQNNLHGYIQDEVNYDDLINNTGWPAASDQPYPYNPPPQDPYPRYQTTPSSYENYSELSHPTYSQISYTNSPYASQYPNARPSEFSSASFIDPSLQTSQGNYGSLSNSFSFAPSVVENATIAPQSLQYNMAYSQAQNRPVATSSFQNPTHGLQQTFDHNMPQYYENQRALSVQSGQGNSVQYPPLPDVTPDPSRKHEPTRSDGDTISAGQPAQQTQPAPAPVVAPTPQNSLRMTDEALYNAKDSSSRPRFAYAPFVAWGDQPIEVQMNGIKNTLPKYQPRKSSYGNPPIPGFDISQTLRPGLVSTKKRSRLRRELNPPVSGYKGTSQKPKILASKINYVREDGSLNSAKSPSTTSETSSSEEESSSDDESEYEDERTSIVDISTVRGAERPADPSEAARWDAIGIVWKPPHLNPGADAIREAIDKYAGFFNALRMEVKAITTKIDEAASRPADVTKLKSQRDVLLESIYQTVDAANLLGYEHIIENLGGHHKLVLGLTSTLIDCTKASDYNGKLPKAVLILLSRFKTLTDELLKKLKFDNIQKRWIKKGNEETKGYITTILSNTTDAKEKSAKTPKEDEGKKVLNPAAQAKIRQPSTTAAPAGSNPAKRPHDGEGINGKAVKKFASDVAGTPTSTVKTTLVKKPTGNLLGITTKPVSKPIPKKQEPPAPSESKLGALLASIAKAPEQPKAAEAPARPPETAEQKAKRERKESRRHLRVKFKEDHELTEVRLFKHEQAEDEGRQDEMLKDAHDERNEGMMHKKRVLETIDDEDDDYQPPDVELPYAAPQEISFQTLEKSSRFGPAYVTRGGDRAVETAEQKKQKLREESELMVVFTDPKDIPPSPKEPQEEDEGYQPESDMKGPHEPWLVQRVQQIHLHGPEYASQVLLDHKENQMSHHLHGNRDRDTATSAKTNDISSGSPSVTSLSNHFKQPASSHSHPVMNSGAISNLVAICDYLKGKPYPPTEPPEWMTEDRKNEWWEGYYRDNPDKKRELDARIQAQLAASHLQPLPHTQTQHYQPQPPSMATAQYPQQAQAQAAYSQGLPQGYGNDDVAAQIQAYMAAYQQQQQNGAAPSTPAFDYTAWAAQQAAALQQNGQSYGLSPSQQFTHNSQTDDDSYEPEAHWNNDNNDLDNEPHVNNNTNSGSGGSGKGRNKKEKRNNYEGKNPTSIDNLFDENGEYKGKKKPCRFWREGKCAKGAKCTFLHEQL